MSARQRYLVFTPTGHGGGAPAHPGEIVGPGGQHFTPVAPTDLAQFVVTPPAGTTVPVHLARVLAAIFQALDVPQRIRVVRQVFPGTFTLCTHCRQPIFNEQCVTGLSPLCGAKQDDPPDPGPVLDVAAAAAANRVLTP